MTPFVRYVRFVVSASTFLACSVPTTVILVFAVLLPGTAIPEEKASLYRYDESKVPAYTLPDPLKTEDGKNVETPEQWFDIRRPELLALFEESMYGQIPEAMRQDGAVRAETTLLESTPLFDGKAVRHQLRIVFFAGAAPTEDDPRVSVLVYVPAKRSVEKRFPAFLGYNFFGNHTVHVDPGIYLGKVWAKPDKGTEKSSFMALDADRGALSRRFPLDLILERGFGLVTAYYGDVEPDFDGGRDHGVRRLVDRDDNGENSKRKPDAAAAVAVWAWGLSRILDAVDEFGEELNLDPVRIAVFGHSRLGKAALWAGAVDNRFAAVISNNSGCCGAALSRREFGETIRRINSVFPHWYCDHFKKYDSDVNACPVDQHELIALIAPRPVYIASASKDLWADPRGEFLGGLHADPVYRLLGTDGFAGVTEMPPIGPSIGGRIGYHLREGEHEILRFDWIHYLDFARKHFE